MSDNVSAPHPSIRFKVDGTASLLHFGFKHSLNQVGYQMSQLMSEDELDEFKWWFSDERIYRYILTQVITMIHVFFEYMAFKDDWKFFSGRKSFRGISVSSLAFSQIRSIIIFLYLLDSDTSYLILFSVGKDIMYNLWKVSKILNMRVEFRASTLLQGMVVPTITYTERKASTSEEDRITASYDEFAIQHMCLCLYPAVIGVALYSLISFTYKSWWSWFISSMADSVYFFGFISMTPQLYINYKLKSVAHLPVKAFMYKIFNTFIDDVFAFLVKMPLKHRIMTLRDDLIFVGFLYQWYIYPADKSRANEFGFQYESKEIAIEDTDDSQKDEDFKRLEYKGGHEKKVDTSDSVSKKVVGRGDIPQVRLKMMELDIGMSLNKVFFNGCQFKNATELVKAAINASKYVHIVVDNEDDQIKVDEELLGEIVDCWFDNNINEILQQKLNQREIGGQIEKRFNYNFGGNIPMSIGEKNEDDNCDSCGMGQRLDINMETLLRKYRESQSIEFSDLEKDLRGAVKLSLISNFSR